MDQQGRNENWPESWTVERTFSRFSDESFVARVVDALGQPEAHDVTHLMAHIHAMRPLGLDELQFHDGRPRAIDARHAAAWERFEANKRERPGLLRGGSGTK